MRWPVADVATEGVRRLEVRALLPLRNTLTLFAQCRHALRPAAGGSETQPSV